MERLLASLLWLGTAGCVSQVVCNPQDATDCRGVGGPAEAIGTAAAAGTIWAAGGGCSIAGCRPPYVCNHETELCEPMTCGEGRECPPPYECDLERKRCF